MPAALQNLGDDEAYVLNMPNPAWTPMMDDEHVADFSDFDWELKIIHDDETLNAFCAPGGYIYVYTGLIKFLAHEDNLAGVIGHEIAHADLRHSTQQLTL